MKQTLLFVDDSPIARQMTIRKIKEIGEFNILEAANGQEGLDQYKKHNPDITFLDLTMPIMDGYEALAEIRAFDPKAVVIILTADVQPRSIAKVLNLGAFTVLKKPPQLQFIQKALENIAAASGETQIAST